MPFHPESLCIHETTFIFPIERTKPVADPGFLRGDTPTLEWRGANLLFGKKLVENGMNWTGGVCTKSY